jgi:hypothetical protein
MAAAMTGLQDSWGMAVVPSLTREWLAIMDVEKAIELGPIEFGPNSAELFYDAACCWAHVAVADPRASSRALWCLRQSVANGLNRDPAKSFLRDHALNVLWQEPALVELAAVPVVPGEPRRAVWVRDPVDGVPQLRRRMP